MSDEEIERLIAENFRAEIRRIWTNAMDGVEDKHEHQR